MATSFCTVAPAGASPTTGTLDPIQLHMQAVNSLSRCKAELMDDVPIYLFALDFLAEAQKAIQALRALELKSKG